MKIRFLGEPALLVENILVLGDLHIGIETDIFRSGISIPSQVGKIEERIIKLLKKTKAKKLVILGDVKHRITGISEQESREVPELVQNLSKKAEVFVVKGNHDGTLEDILDNVYDPSGLKIGDYAFIHGQKWPKAELLDAKVIFMSHSHPVVELWSSGVRLLEKCWIKCEIDNSKLEKKLKGTSKLEQGFIIPSFNHIITGTAFNSEDFKPMGPFLRNNVFKWEQGEVYLLDGTYLGKVKEL